MKKYFPFFCVLIFVACNNSPKDGPSNSGTKDTGTTASPAVIETQAFTVLPFDKNNTLFKDSIKGNLIDGLSWKDSEGENTALFCALPVASSKDGLQSGYVYAYCFTKTGDGWKRKWLVQDKIEKCEVDATCEYLPGSFTITDEDKNNIGEVTFLYKLSCKGDVSPDDKKLIMYEGVNKYVIRGSTILQFENGKDGGDKRVDASFAKAAKPLLDFANLQWDKFGTTKF